MSSTDSFQLSDIDDEDNGESSKEKDQHITQASPRIKCSNCSKTYKFQGGLTRHIKAKHPELLPALTDFLSKDELENLISKTKMQLVNDRCYPPVIKERFKEDAQFDINFEILLKELQKIFGKLRVSGKVENFKTDFRTQIVDYAEKFFEVDYHIAGIFSTTLGDVLYHYHKTKDEGDSPVMRPVKPITEEEHDGLQNLAGYVIHQLLKKSNGKKGNKLVAPLLISFKTDDLTDQRYIQMQSRGGLTAVKAECQQIFFKTEEIFRRESAKEIRKISAVKIRDIVLKDPAVISKFQSLVQLSGCIASSETEAFVLESMVELFIRLRTHSLSRDYIQNYKLKVKSLKSNKHGLRKSIKKAMNKPTELHEL